MREMVRPFAAPISVSPSLDHGEAWGTGSYVVVGGQTYLLTNHHVYADVPPGWKLHHLPGPTDDYLPIECVPQRKGWPVDACALSVDQTPVGDLAAISLSLFDSSFDALAGELLFWTGYPGTTALRNVRPTDGQVRKTRFEQPLHTVRHSMLSQAHQDWDGSHKDFDAKFHVAVHYPAEAQQEFGGCLVASLNAKGMSGSLLWDTKSLLAEQQNKPWQPENARVCGLIWAAIKHPEVVFATKIEHVRNALPLVFDSP